MHDIWHEQTMTGLVETLMMNSRIHQSTHRSGILLAISALTGLIMFPVSPAVSEWKDDIGVFRIGVVSNKEKATATRQAEPFREAMQQELGIPVKIVIASSYRGLIEAHASKKIQYGIHTAASFATTWTKCKCVVPIAAAKLADGTLKYHSILMVKKDRISQLRELKGKRIAISSKSSLSGYLFPKHLLGNKDLHFSDNPTEPDDTVIVNAGTTANSRKLFQADLVDGLFGWSSLSGLANTGYSAGTLADLFKVNELSMADISVIWKSEPIFNGPHAIDDGAPEIFREKISKFLLNLFENNPRAYDSVENFRGGGFGRVELSDYRPVISFIDAGDTSTTAAGVEK